MLIVLITGATGGGLSRALTLALLADDKFIVYAPVRSTEKGESLYKNEKRKPIFLKHDLSDSYNKVQELVQGIEAKHGAVDLLINSAGMGRNWPLECESDETMVEAFNINTLGPIRLCKAVLNGMKRKKSGQIINVSSIGGFVPDEMTEIYNASKYALTGFSESLQLTSRHFGINVTVVGPGPMDTPSLWSSVVKDYPKEVCDKKTQELIDRKIVMMRDFKKFSAKVTKPESAANLIMENVVNNPKPELFYMMTFGYCQDKLDAKYKDLQSYGLKLSKLV